MEYFGRKGALWWGSGKFFGKSELDFEVSACIRSSLWKMSKVSGTYAKPALRESKIEFNLPGPSIMPITSRILSSLVCTRIPSGGDFLSSDSSLIRRRRAAGETDCSSLIILVEWGVRYYAPFSD